MFDAPVGVEELGELMTVTFYITITPLSGHTVSSWGHRSPRLSQNPA